MDHFTKKESPNEMTEKQDNMIDLVPDRERHVVIGVIPPHQLGPGEEPLQELIGLVEAAGADVVGSMWQKRRNPHMKTYLGKGKLVELKQLLGPLKAHTLTVDADLSPAQLKSLEETFQMKVIDRSEVILDIFASRARTHQAQLQVSLAQSQYELPRLGRKWLHLERLGGGIGTRGPGESQIETDRRLLRTRIKQLEEQLSQIETRRKQEVEARGDEYTISLVGYTNAGKSTLMNALTHADAFVKDQLFATLDTLTRPLELDSGMEVLLSDTVGFIRRLPHHLVASFHATLEEAVQSKLLLHVVDASSPLAREQIRAVNQTLKEIGCVGREHIYVLNKVDQCTDPALLEMLQEHYRPSVTISAVTGEGLDTLREMLRVRAAEKYLRKAITLRFPASDGKRLAAINQHGKVFDLVYEGEMAVARVEMAAPDIHRLKRFPGPMTIEA